MTAPAHSQHDRDLLEDRLVEDDETEDLRHRLGGTPGVGP
jgi:hypothetical protein